MFIYKAVSKTTGKVYIGQTAQTLQERINQHNSHAYGHQYNYHFHNAIRKYGPEDFTYEIIEDSIKSTKVLNEREKYWIAYYDSYYNGYNSTLGGEGCMRRDDELIVKLFREGYTTQEICEITGYNRQTVYRSYSINGLTEDNNRRKSEQNRERCSRTVDQYSLDGKYIKTWSSATECGKNLGNQGLISAICRQEKSILSAYGFLFKYTDDPRDISEWVARLKNKKDSGRPKKEIEQYDSDNNLVCTYESASAAATALGKKDKSNICAAARKGVKAYGYYWRYK
jgi:group I intron endonuclease